MVSCTDAGRSSCAGAKAPAYVFQKVVTLQMSSDSMAVSGGASALSGTTIVHQISWGYLSLVLSMALRDPACPRSAAPGPGSPGVTITLAHVKTEKRRRNVRSPSMMYLQTPTGLQCSEPTGSPPLLHLLARTLTTLISQQKAGASGGQYHQRVREWW